MDAIASINYEQLRFDIPTFRAGDTVAVHVRIKEGDKERIQVFKGVVIRFRKGTIDSSFTVRKVSNGIGVERIFPTFSPIIDKIEVVSEGQVRRSRLYYLRDLRGKAAKVKTKNPYFKQNTPKESSK
ncbi:MAG: 50S ribosomal protein L19 [Deltaproteobacteria bacterium]|jgi:large subunit ribosomal protein L19|nr:50S ribosomal protein L19 [Deltaproteobacteria bacterium]